jgi:hypothetical protein
MANYYTNFSVVVSLPDAAAVQYAVALSSKVKERQELLVESELTEPAMVEFSDDAIEDWNFETEAQSGDGFGVWLHSENGGGSAACEFIQHLLQKFDSAGHVCLEWSNDCDKPRLDAFGGGAAFITSNNIEYMSTGAWLDEKLMVYEKAKSEKV